MTINLPSDSEPPAETAKVTDNAETSDPLIGAFRDAAAEMDDMVAHAMKYRGSEAWRLTRVE